MGAFTLLAVAASPQVLADTPLGWINAGNTSAYTTTRGEIEIGLAGLAVNDTIDFLNYRDDLIANNSRLTGDTGDLSGTRLELHYGITNTLDVFLKLQQQSLTIELGPISSINVVDKSDSLDTKRQSAGFKWTFFEGNLLNPDNRRSAASLELSAYANRTDDFDVEVDEINIDNLLIQFRDPQTFSVNDLEDQGWRARIIYTWPMDQFIGSIWGGYGESASKSGTTSDLTSITFAKFFEQSFKLDQSQLFLGASLTLQLLPRLPITLNYEYISISDSKLTRNPETPVAGLPSFLTGVGQAIDTTNHTFNAHASYWLTPQISVGAFGNLYSNQFLGVMPHFDNPLSGSFSSTPYGFVGLDLLIKI